MSEKDITKFLQVLGLSKKETEVYMFLAENGVRSTSFVAKKLKMERVQAYRTFKKLQEEGFIEATFERPTRFSIVPFEKLMEGFINSKRSEVESLNKQKESLLNSWRSIRATEPEYPVAKFSVITGKKKIHSRMKRMVEESNKEVIVLTTGLGLIQEEIDGIFDFVAHPTPKRSIKYRILTEISEENLKIVERIEKRFSIANRDIKCRHLNLSSKLFPRFLIKDGEEAILYTSNIEEPVMHKLEYEGLWINDIRFISILKAFFVQMWQNGIDASRRIGELKSGIPLSETIVIKDPEEAWTRVRKIFEMATKEVMLITSSQSISSLLETDPFGKYCKKGLRCRIMASIDFDNLETAKKLSAICEIRNVPISYLSMMIIDEKHLFIFKKPPLSETSNSSAFYLADTFYSNDPSSTERVGEMLNDIWKRGTEISEINAQAGTKMPNVEATSSETMEELVDKILRNGVSSVLIIENQKPVGIVDDRELLREIVENHKDPKKTRVKDLGYTPLISLSSNESISHALHAMRKKGMKRAAVIKNGQLIAMLTEGFASKNGRVSIKSRV